MFTHPAPVAPSSSALGSSVPAVDHASPSLASPTSRTSRLRGLSLLRNLARDHSSQQHPTAPASSATAPAPAPAQQSSDPPSSSSSSHNPPPTPSAAPSSRQTRPPLRTYHSSPISNFSTGRFSLVPALSAHPLVSLAPPFGNASASTSTPPLPTPPLPSPAAVPGPVTDPSTSPAAVTNTTVKVEDSHAAVSTPSDDDAMTRTRSATTGGHEPNTNVNVLPSIRFSTFYDPRATRPSLTFSPISRTLPQGNETIRVGRYSERETQPSVPQNAPSAAPVGFKSKVVSRRHCEFWYEDGKWYIKDVKSSSGTFLNHIRLSPPGTESKPFPVNDGDIVQLGIDFKGGEEMIFRCVKMRLELNRGWQSKLNTFNMNTHKRLRNMTASSGNNAAGQSYSQDCSICLNSIAPCQCLFVAPCSHTWHYKCIRSLLAAPSYPIFICPNCRAAADLEAEVEDPEEWEQLDSDECDPPQEGALLNARDSSENQASLALPRMSKESVRSTRSVSRPVQEAPQPMEIDSGGDITMLMDDSSADVVLQSNGMGLAETNQIARPYSSTSNPVPIPTNPFLQRATPNPAPVRSGDDSRDTRTPSPTDVPVVLNGTEGPITPRNDAGPWVFDGSGARLRPDGTPAAPGEGGPVMMPQITSLEGAVTSAGVPAA